MTALKKQIEAFRDFSSFIVVHRIISRLFPRDELNPLTNQRKKGVFCGDSSYARRVATMAEMNKCRRERERPKSIQMPKIRLLQETHSPKAF